MKNNTANLGNIGNKNQCRRSVIQQNPNMLTTMLQQIGRSNPELLSIISQVDNNIVYLECVLTFASCFRIKRLLLE